MRKDNRCILLDDLVNLVDDVRALGSQRQVASIGRLRPRILIQNDDLGNVIRGAQLTGQSLLLVSRSARLVRHDAAYLLLQGELLRVITRFVRYNACVNELLGLGRLQNIARDGIIFGFD